MSDQIESFFKGDTKSWTLTWKREGAAINVSAAEMYMTIKSNKSDVDGSAVLQLSVSSGVELTTDGTDGKFTASITAAQTNAMSVETTYYYDFRLIESDGTVTTAPGGTFTVREPITQAIT